MGKDPISNILYIDLNRKRFWVEDRSELFEKYIGGTGVAIKLLEEEVPKNADPLGPENVIIFTVGPFNGVYPMASKTVAMFKSPLTGNLGESHAGGRSSIAIRLAGYGGIVIRGVSDIPVYIAIHEKKVYFRNASTLWGMRSSFTVGRIIRENEPGAGVRTIMRIGRAGEKLVRYACVVTETYRHFGRLGLGAVFGSKKLKAILISGRRHIPIKDKPLYRKIYGEIFDEAVNTPLMKKYHEIGTPVNVLRLNKIKGLPTKNLLQNYFEQAEKISGEYFAEKYLGRRVACSHCPVGCIHLAALKIPYEDVPYFEKTIFISYDYEPIYAVGSMLGIGDPEGVLKIIHEVDTYGLDAMSTGVVLAWLTEAFQRNLISIEDTNGLKFKWGDYETYTKAVRNIVYQPTELYKAVANGVEYASKIYGGEEFAMAFGGNEMPGYHTGPLSHFSYLVGSRHSHLDMAGYSLDQKLLGKTIVLEEAVEKLLREEEWRQVLTSLVICLFARGIYRPEMVSNAFKPLGIEFSVDDLMEIGKIIHREKYKFKIREGFDLDKVRIPERIFQTPTPHGYIDKKSFLRMIEIFKTKIKYNELKMEI